MGTRRTILLVDDAPIFLEIEALFLTRVGRVLCASGGEEALEIARREHPAVIVADAFMPGLNGAGLCRAVRRHRELDATRVVIVTSSDRAEDHAEAIHAGADDVLSKPINRLTLIETVQRFVRYANVRGLPRAPFRGSVRIEDGSTDWVGKARNISRGGIFVEGGKELSPHSEVTLEFDLPDEIGHVRPTAEVVWLENDPEEGLMGMGLRFVGLDGSSLRSIDDWVHERTLRAPALA